MPTVRVNGVELFYKETGHGPETIVFSHGLLMDHSMFEAQRAALEKTGRYRVIAYDHRGQGQPQDPGGGYDMETLSHRTRSALSRRSMLPRAISPGSPWEALWLASGGPTASSAAYPYVDEYWSKP